MDIKGRQSGAAFTSALAKLTRHKIADAPHPLLIKYDTQGYVIGAVTGVANTQDSPDGLAIGWQEGFDRTSGLGGLASTRLALRHPLCGACQTSVGLGIQDWGLNSQATSKEHAERMLVAVERALLPT
ncbi:uncharacterized protein PV09_08222 [Verruconis gallopava]|uniref:Uncharacterized protein n=1 Tax=Verruconis gallopava TaxID=253628 RepID=A0A0D1XD72_9PEZI|nr:uncharacterized protein PV09_08222 [Verruconis gallopava]KIW00181.1 hypothetical protein PV09_08222 [Verruconis gallopava]